MLNLAVTFKALGEPVRLRLFSLLAESEEVCVCHLTDALGLPQSTVSRHLGVLRHAGLVKSRRDGKWIHYQLAPEVPDTLRLLVSGCDQPEREQDMFRLQQSRGC